MAKSLRSKMTSMALCCTVVTGAMVQTPVFANAEEKVSTNQGVSQEIKIPSNYLNVESTTSSTLDLENQETIQEEVVEQEIVPEEMTQEESEKVIQEELKNELEEEKLQEVQLGKYIGLPSDGIYHMDMNVWNETKDEESMAAQFFTKEDVILTVENGKGILKVVVSTTGFGQKDVITSLEQREGSEGSYSYNNLTMAPVEGEEKVTVEVEIDNLSDAIFMRCGIKPMGEAKPSLRLMLLDDTLEKVANLPVVNPIVSLPADGIYKLDMKAWHETKDENSMAAQFFKKEDVELLVKEGKGTLKVEVTTSGMGKKDIITSLEQREGSEGSYSYNNLTMTPVEGEEKVTVEVEIENLSDVIYMRCGINIMGGMKPSLRLILLDDTLEKVADLPVVNPIVNLPKDGAYKLNMKAWHETKDEDSMATQFFKREDVELLVKEGKGTLKVEVATSGMGQKDIITSLEQRQGNEGNYTYKNLELIPVDGEEKVIVAVEIDNLSESIYMRCGIKPMGEMKPSLRLLLLPDTLEKVEGELPEEKPEEIQNPVTIQIQKTDLSANGAKDGSITVEALGGAGNYEYTIDEGLKWQDQKTFSNLESGIYKVAARDSENKENISTFETVELKTKNNNVTGETLQDGYYSVDIEVLHETNNQTSMAAQFFNTEKLPLLIQNGKAYLTIQVLKDGMNMTDVITSLEQKVEGKYKALSLDYLNDNSKRYIVSEVEFNSINDEAYVRCGIKPMAPMKPVLRIKLVESSIKAGMGSINTNIVPQIETQISSVKAENGKVEIKLNSADDSLTASQFTAKLYKDNKVINNTLKLNDFKNDKGVITFTYDEILGEEEEQKLVVGVTFNNVETKSNTFTIPKLGEISVPSNKKARLKENALEIKYIRGYEDGKFRPQNNTTRAETLSMLMPLIEEIETLSKTVSIDVLHATKEEDSMAKQFFKTEGIQVVEEDGKYKLKIEIANDGLGFKDIIGSVEQKIGNEFKALEVQKTEDLTKAYVTLDFASLQEEVTLRVGITPMGGMKPELRIVPKKETLKEERVKESTMTTQFNDINMWAKETILFFEKLGLISNKDETMFRPNDAITVGEFLELTAQIEGLDAETLKNEETDLNQTITRAEMVSLINKLIGHTKETNIHKEEALDLEEAYWAYEEIKKVTL